MPDDSDFPIRLMHQLSSLIDGMKTLNERVAETMGATDRFDAEFTKLSRYSNQLRSDVLDVKSEVQQHRSETSQFRSDINQRLQAILHRMDELENAVDANSNQIRELRSDARSQYNEILTALQTGLQNNVSLRELVDRVEDLERRLGT
jgi:chromosome segregation ATPase